MTMASELITEARRHTSAAVDLLLLTRRAPMIDVLQSLAAQCRPAGDDDVELAMLINDARMADTALVAAVQAIFTSYDRLADFAEQIEPNA